MAKVMKIGCAKQKLQINPQKSFQIMSDKILKGVKRNQNIPSGSFAYELRDLGDVFAERGQKAEMNRASKKLAETLVSAKNGDLAGVIYSFLVKFNEDNPKAAEEFATNGLAVAKRLKDDVHIVARCHDLRDVYKTIDPKSDKLLKTMYEEKRALSNIVNDYSTAEKRYNTISRKMAPKSKYEFMLGSVKIKIAEFLLEKEPKIAKIELSEARMIFEKLNEKQAIAKIDQLLEKCS